MRYIVPVFGLLALPAHANVLYQWSDPAFTDPFTDASIVVTDAAVAGEFLAFGDGFGDQPGWVSGFNYPNPNAAISVSLIFRPDGLLEGFVHIDQLDSDVAYNFDGTGKDWTAVFIDGPETRTESGFYQDPIPEPSSLLILTLGLLTITLTRRLR